MIQRTLRLLQVGGAGSRVGGGRVTSLMGGMRAGIVPTVESSAVDEAALAVKMDSLLAHDMEHSERDDADVTLRREWVRAPVSSLSTSASRRDWFRVMSFNMMTDRWNDGAARTTPVENVRVRVPSFTRASIGEAGDSSEYCDYDPAVDKELPPFLTSEFRRRHLVSLLRHYDPDIVCLNEVNRTFFFGDMWRYVRFLGYGMLYQSSRGAWVRVLRRGDRPDLPRNANKIPESEDIGNAMLFHKSRFVPLMLPGRDLAKHFHFAQIAGMRDKVTNMTLYVACVQLTAGDTDDAVALRLHEAKQITQILDALWRDDGDRSHMSVMLCGDLNNVRDDEPCVELLRDRFFSTHDVVGGPRWTAWHYRNAEETSYGKYFRKNVEEMKASSLQCTAEAEIERFRRDGGGKTFHGPSSKFRLVHEKRPDPQYPWIVRTAVVEEKKVENEESKKSAAKPDQLAVMRKNMEDQGIVYRTQDFMFYDPNALALHKVLDVPADSEVDEEQLFPNNKLPSHHLPLMVDVSFNDTSPDVALMSRKP